MKKKQKGKIRKLINLEEKDGKARSLYKLNKRLHYLKSKLSKRTELIISNQMKYIEFHIKKLGGKV